MKLGFIGCGNMAQAMITGILTQKVVSPQELIVSNPCLLYTSPSPRDTR